MLLDAHDLLRLRPQPFQVVAGTLLEREQVHDHATEVEQHPSPIGVALAADGVRRVELVARAVNVVDERVQLPIVIGRGDDEVVGERAERGEVEHDHIRCLPVDQNVDGVVREL